MTVTSIITYSRPGGTPASQGPQREWGGVDQQCERRHACGEDPGGGACCGAQDGDLHWNQCTDALEFSKWHRFLFVLWKAWKTNLGFTVKAKKPVYLDPWDVLKTSFVRWSCEVVVASWCSCKKLSVSPNSCLFSFVPSIKRNKTINDQTIKNWGIHRTVNAAVLCKSAGPDLVWVELPKQLNTFKNPQS